MTPRGEPGSGRGSPRREGRPTVRLSLRHPAPGVGRETIRRRAARMLVSLGQEDAELSIVLADDAFVRELNRDYRGQDRPTDVLSFSLREGEDPAPGNRLLGDVVVSLDTAARQAGQGRRTLLDEVTELLAHGILHLLGHDHPTAADERRMRGLTAQLLGLFPR